MQGFPVPPHLEPHTAPEPSPLPERWSAAALLTPWDSAQLVVARVVCDSTLGAMRVTAYGVEQGSVDLLLVDNAAFLVSGEGLLGPIETDVIVPVPGWLAGRVACQGTGDVLDTACEWWTGATTCQTSYQNGGRPPLPVANTFNIRRDSGAPWRMVFVNPTNDYRLPVLGAYAIVHLPYFQAMTSTDLDRLLSLVPSATPAPSGVGVSTAEQIEDLLAASADGSSSADAAARRDAIDSLIPGVRPAGAEGRLPFWPERMFLTSYSTPTAGPAPLPTQVFYDWPQKRMLTRMWLPDGGYEDGILDANSTHVVLRDRYGGHRCGPVLPVGLVRPRWAGDDHGACRAIITNERLSPGRTTYACVLPSRPGQVFWTWYTGDDVPVMFIEVPQAGDVMLLLTDYATWDPEPGVFDPALFEVPSDCLTPPES